MNLDKIKEIDKKKLFKWHSSLKEWNLKDIEWFLIKDSFYFNEYWIVDTNNIIEEFIKKNKRKWKYLYDIVKKWDISLNITWHITVASWLGFTLDKINFISLWYRKNVDMIKIITEDNYFIIVTKNKKILTNNGYIKAKDIKNTDCLIWITWNSYNNFKKNWNKDEYIDIYNLLLELKKIISNTGLKKIEIMKISKKHRNYLNIIWIDTSDKILTLEKIEILLKWLEWKNELKEILILNDKNSKYKKLFHRKIKTIKEIKIKDAYIWSIISKLSNNCIINNIIIEK